MRIFNIFILLFSTCVFSWNATGHKVIAQIAYDNISKEAKHRCSKYNYAVNKSYKKQNLINAATWLDYIKYKYKNDKYLHLIHYINLTFSQDSTPLPKTIEPNALTAIKDAVKTLESNANDYQKGMALRILLHVIGDIHQPLHATSRVSKQYPFGDKGGHEVRLYKNRIANNLHSYWDNGGGYLINNSKHKKHNISIRKKAKELEREYPCNLKAMSFNPDLWAKESHEEGVLAYKYLHYLNLADYAYQARTISIVKQRLSLAACRLAFVLENYC